MFEKDLFHIPKYILNNKLFEILKIVNLNTVNIKQGKLGDKRTHKNLE
jgi:hypothetical protein